MTGELTRKDWLCIHEALCFASTNENFFEYFLNERREEVALTEWKKGKTTCGHDLIGKVCDKMS